MISLLFSALVSPQTNESSAWVAELLRSAPASAPSQYIKPPIRHPNGGVIAPDGELDPRAPGVPASTEVDNSPWAVLRRRASELLDHRDYEGAFREILLTHPDDELEGPGDVFLDAALLSGRHALAEKVLVQQVRLRQRPGVHVFSNTVELELSIATALRGKVYPGQGAYVLADLRESLSVYPDQARLVEKLKVPTTPRDVAFVSLLALAKSGSCMRPLVYLEKAFEMDPKCELAADELLSGYEGQKRYADAARVATSMLKWLPAGEKRDLYAWCLERVQKGQEAAKAGG